MKAFKVFLNGEQIRTAGIGPHGVLSAIVNWVGGGLDRADEGHFHMHLGGLDCRTDEHVRWPVPELKVGDEISILIVETNEVDAESERSKAGRDGHWERA
jgi:hypothetical protein